MYMLQSDIIYYQGIFCFRCRSTHMFEKVFSRFANLHRDSSQYKFTADHQNTKITLQLKIGSLMKQIIFQKYILHCVTLISE
jgi:hypothetical protein